MENAILCAQAVESQYLDNMSDQAMLSAVSGVSLIALTAYTAGIAINDAHTTNVTDFALGTSAIYGMSHWLSQPNRSQIYGAGAKALHCAVQSSLPFNEDKAILDEYKQNIQNLVKQINLTEVEIGKTRTMVSTADTSSTALITFSEYFVTEANSTANTGAARLTTYKTAPATLVAAVNQINSIVNGALVDSIQPIGALPGTLNGVMNMYSGINKGLIDLSEVEQKMGMPPGTKGASTVSGFSDQTTILRNKLTHLAEAKANVDFFNKALTPSLPKTIAEECGVDLTKIQTALTFKPTSINFDKSQLTRRSVQIAGGTGSYIYSYDDATFEIKQTPPFGPTLQIMPASTAQPGTYFINVRDNGNAKGEIEVTIKP